MKRSLYTKSILTIIAIILIGNAYDRYINPFAIVQAQSAFGGVQFSATPRGDEFFDSRTGELWLYDENGQLSGKYKITKLGQPLVRQ